jgi:hypothetical protein
MAVLAVASLVLTGCAAERTESIATASAQCAAAPSPVREAPVAVPVGRPIASGLIFDRQPGTADASQFTWRSDWPSTDSYTRRPESIQYREHFHDSQGPGDNSLHDWTYRRFDSIRSGEATR